MSKKKTFLSILKHANDALHALESAGIDVDRLIGISNAQGPQAKLIRELLTPEQVSAVSDVEIASSLNKSARTLLLPAKTRSKKRGKTSA